MKAIQFITMTALTAVLLSSCKKDDDISPNPDNPSNITLLNSNEWTVVANNVQKKQQGVLGGSFGTAAFSLQKQDELRWYLYFSHMTGYQDPIEIVINNQNTVTVNKPTGNTGSDFRDIKTIYGMDTWETHISFNNASNISTFKNGQHIDIGYPYKPIKKLQTSEDGLLNNTEHFGGTNWVSHYHYGTGQWKNNVFWATQYVSTRYNGKTYVATLLNDGTTGTQGTITVLEESNTPDASNMYLMTTKNEDTIPNAGYILHSVRHNENLYVALNAQWQNKYVVYKINLNNYSVQKVVEETKVENYDNTDPLVRNLAQNIEIDPQGNLYIVHIRVENMDAHYSIRKYKSTGGNEVILKENDLKNLTKVQGIYYFNNKLHAALVYREELAAESKPNENFWMSNYHMQIISKN
ncbi:MAG: hypothetical protein JNM67_08410 [Bacteroidetes bacterium]|nr:hypothetical protein [Bacteroidota bacterium]